MSTNDITGDKLISKPGTKAFDENFYAILRNKQTITEAMRILNPVVNQAMKVIMQGKEDK